MLNKTAFPELQVKRKLIPNFSHGDQPSNEGERWQTKHDFFLLVKEKELVYERINNRNNNHINDMRYFSSFFLPLKEGIKCKTTPIFELMPRIQKSLRPQEYSSDEVMFRSNFESGNLFCAFRNSAEILPTYELFMQNDINTKGCTQWFYFSVQA